MQLNGLHTQKGSSNHREYWTLRQILWAQQIAQRFPRDASPCPPHHAHAIIQAIVLAAILAAPAIRISFHVSFHY